MEIIFILIKYLHHHFKTSSEFPQGKNIFTTLINLINLSENTPILHFGVL